MRLAILIAVTSVAACAQQPAIQGVVLESPSDYPVAGAEVSILSETAPMKTTTDANGAFHFHPDAVGLYRLQVKKDGYGQSTGNILNSVAMLSRERPTSEVRLYL